MNNISFKPPKKGTPYNPVPVKMNKGTTDQSLNVPVTPIPNVQGMPNNDFKKLKSMFIKGK